MRLRLSRLAALLATVLGAVVACAKVQGRDGAAAPEPRPSESTCERPMPPCAEIGQQAPGSVGPDCWERQADALEADEAPTERLELAACLEKAGRVRRAAAHAKLAIAGFKRARDEAGADRARIKLDDILSWSVPLRFALPGLGDAGATGLQMTFDDRPVPPEHFGGVFTILAGRHHVSARGTLDGQPISREIDVCVKKGEPLQVRIEPGVADTCPTGWWGSAPMQSDCEVVLPDRGFCPAEKDGGAYDVDELLALSRCRLDDVDASYAALRDAEREAQRSKRADLLARVSAHRRRLDRLGGRISITRPPGSSRKLQISVKGDHGLSVLNTRFFDTEKTMEVRVLPGPIEVYVHSDGDPTSSTESTTRLCLRPGETRKLTLPGLD